MKLLAGVLLLMSADVRDSLADKTAVYYREIFAAAKAGEPGKAASALERLAPVAKALDERSGGKLASRAGKASSSAESLDLWAQAMIFQSMSSTLDDIAADPKDEAGVRKRIRYAIEEFAEIEGQMKKRGDAAFKSAIEIRKSYQRALFLLDDPAKFKENADGIRKAFAVVYPSAVALTLKWSLQATAGDGRQRGSAAAAWAALEGHAKGLGEEKARRIAAGIGSEPGAAKTAAEALEELYPETKEKE